MKIIVLGAGQVGSTVAQNLAHENNDVTLVDTNLNTLQELQSRIDLNTVYGHAAHPNILRQAGAEDADMIIAATSSDETNMIACQIAYTLFKTTSRIARIRSQEYLKEKNSLFKKKHIPIDVLISPERLVTDHIERIIQHPGALQVVDFADGRVRLVGVISEASAPMTGKPVSAIHDSIPNVSVCIAAIFRDNEPLTGEDVVIIEGDIVFYIAAKGHTVSIMEQFHQPDKPSRLVMIAGGGNIGMALAKKLENKYRVKIVEKDPNRAVELGESLDSSLVLCGDVADQDLLLEENISSMDLFCALTNDDEANILSAMVARKMGARSVMSLINRPAYVDLVERGFIDVAISPHNVTIGALLRHVRRGDVVAVHSLRRGTAEALEAIAHGDKDSSEVVGRKISELALGEGITIGAVVRGNQVIIGDNELEIEAEDHVIVFVADKNLIPAVEDLFQVGIIY